MRSGNVAWCAAGVWRWGDLSVIVIVNVEVAGGGGSFVWRWQERVSESSYLIFEM